MWLRRIGLALGIVLAVGVVAAGVVLPPWLDAQQNSVAPPPASGPSEAALRLHAGLRVADLHADSLLWSRDLLRRSGRGHVDLPRLREGNVALQVFGVVTKSPRGQNYERTPGDSDRITALVMVQRWPLSTWGSLRARAIHQAEKLDRAARRSEGGLVPIRSREDLERLLAARKDAAGPVGALLALEGSHALEAELAGVDRLFDAGFRMMAPTHFFDNAVAGSSAGVEKGGLTELGRRVIRRMEELGIAVDLAHASPRTIDDVLALATRPVLVSHTGVQAVCPGPRNLGDAHVRAIAAAGGVIGIGFWDGAVCDATPAGIARSIRHVRDAVGAAHVALGSDFDGTIHAPFDVGGLALVTDALLAEGLAEEEIRLVMGENVLRLLAELLPPGATPR